MGLWRLLGGEINWERVAKMQDRAVATEIHSAIMNALGGGLWNQGGGLSIDRLNDDKQNNVMWALEKFGRQVPTTAKFRWLTKSHTNNASDLRPKETGYNQLGWNQAWEWYDAYKSGTIPFLEYRIKIREKELEEDEKNLEKHIQEIKPNRLTRKLIKSYTKDIPEQKTEIAKLKSELETLKAKEMQIQKEKHSDLSLENENLQLKKQILEMELKLKNFNKER